MAQICAIRKFDHFISMDDNLNFCIRLTVKSKNNRRFDLNKSEDDYLFVLFYVELIAIQ